jgi:tetratricopeptide (TPR) repeat protein
MYISRRSFIQAAALSGTFSLARFHKLLLCAASESSSCLLHSGSEYAPFIHAFLDQLQPGRDSFVTEQYAAELRAMLDGWSQSLCSLPWDLQPITKVLALTLDASAIGEARLTTLRSHPPIESEKAVYPQPRPFDRAAFVATLQAYLGPFTRIETAEFQISGIEVAGTEPLRVVTEIHYDLVGALEHDRREERSGAWNLVWQKDSPGQWLIFEWSAASELRSRLTGPGFVDITASCLAANLSYDQQLEHGVDHWRTVLDGACGIDIYGNNGIAAGDFDGDGFDDLYVCQPAGLPNRLYRNRGDGTFEDVTEKAGVGILDGTSSAIFADLNNNGRQDLIVVRTSGPLLYVNRGDGAFELKPDAFQFATTPAGTFTGIALADYDRDGLLDVYFCLYNFYEGLSEYQYPSPYYDARNGPPNFLLKNQGNYTFEDVTASSGMDRNNNRFSFACSWRDYNHDGWPDLYVVNDFGRKVLYRNNGNGTFTDVSVAAGVEDPGEGMSVTWLDYDNDGFDDLYVVNMWEPAGKRIMTQAQFLPHAPQDVRRVYLKDALGNTLLRNEQGKGTFRDVTDDSGTRLGGWNWGSDAWDLDHDGYPDLYVTNGFISGPEKDNLSSFFWRQVVAQSFAGKGRVQAYEDAWNAINELIRTDHSWSGYQRNNCYINNGNGSFTEAAGVLGLDILDDSRAFALSDLNHNGRLDVILKNRTAPQVRILANRLSPLGLTIGFFLKGTKSNRDAIGAVIELETPAGRQRKTVSAGSGFLMQHTKDVYFGLGSVRGTVRAVVHWPSGAEQVFEGLPPGHRIEIVEGSPTVKATPFAEATATPPSPAAHRQEVPHDASETWLVEAILAPGFILPDGHGGTRSLRDYQGQPLVLTFCRSDCLQSHKQLDAMEKHWPEWQRNQLQLLAMRVDDSDEGVRFSFPILTADETTRAVYNIFHRYLFERRRDMLLPTTFLLDTEGAVIKIYSGYTDPLHILDDWQSAPVGVAARLRKALPFSGPYLGKGMHHNYFTYGVAFLRYGYLDQALSSFRQAIEKNPSYAAAYYNIGLIYLKQQKLGDARANLEQAVALDAGNANVWNNLGVACGELGDYTGASNAFARALTLEPAHLLALENMVKVYQAQGRSEDARKVLETAIAADPNQVGLHIGLAMLLADKNDLQNARSEFEKAVALEPVDPQALNGLGVVLMRMGKRTDAIERFEECRQLAPASDRAYLNLALIYAKSGDTRKARDILEQYPQTQHDSPDVRKALRDLEGAP